MAVKARTFIPFDNAGVGCLSGIFNITQGMVSSVERDFVQLDKGEKIGCSYLAIPSGSSQPLPAKVVSSSNAEACKELQRVQQNIKAVHTIAIIVGGAVGVEIAMDIKSYYPRKQITIVHSHHHLLPHFGSRLHEYVCKEIDKMGVELQLGERRLLLFETGMSNGLITDATLHFSKQG